jgi:hypothetical protein
VGQTCISSKGIISRTERFLKKVRIVHGDTYDYSKVDYIDARTKVIIICKIHREFEQTPDGHVQGRGCEKCGKIRQGKSKRLGLKKFVEKAVKVHGNFYEHSKVKYKTNSRRVTIICPYHGEFLQTANHHLQGNG